MQGKEGKYGDWVYQGDDMLGQIMDALKRNGQDNKTLLIATGDNGAAGRSYEPLRDNKSSIYEGGHREPFVARWPGKIKPGTTSDQVICLNDLFATCADLLGKKLPPDAAEDSVSILPALLGEAKGSIREATIHQAPAGLAIRQGHWKLITLRNGTRELYNLQEDLGETRNLFDSNKEKAVGLQKLLQSYIDRGRSTPGLSRKTSFLSISISPRARRETRRTGKPVKPKNNVKITVAALLVALLFAVQRSPKNPIFCSSSWTTSPRWSQDVQSAVILDTPNIDRLAKEGMVLDGAYHMGAWVGGVCTPSRHMVMSGRTVGMFGQTRSAHESTRYQSEKVPPDLVQYTLPAVFNRAGYDTMRTCKNGNSYEAANKLFSVRHDGTRRGGTDETGSHWHGERVMEYLNEREASKDKDPF